MANGVVVHNTLPKSTRWAKALRSCYPTIPGHVLWQLDFSEGELRIAADLSEDPTMIKVYRDKKSLHAMTGATLAGISIEEMMTLKDKDREEYDAIRKRAKACIAKGSLVLTNNGMKPIESVDKSDLVWDGIEWVHHDGVIYQGYKEVITHEGLTATPDHQCWTEEERYIPFGEVASSMGRQKIVIGEVNGNPIKDRHLIRKDFFYKGAQENTGRMLILSKRQSIPCRFYPSRNNHGMPMSGEKTVLGQKIKNFRESLRLYCSEVHKSTCYRVQTLWGSWYKEFVPKQTPFYNLDVKAPSSYGLQGGASRSERQQRALQYEKCQISLKQNEHVEQAHFKTGFLQGTESVCVSFVGFIKNGLSRFPFKQEDNRGVSYSRENSTGDTTDQAPKKAHVYDIINAGPRHRFTVSGKIVSNCNFGYIYGMQAPGFREYARTGFNLIISLKEAEDNRNLFFSTYDRLTPWHTQAVRVAQKQGYISSPLGRIRHLPLINSRNWFLKSQAERQSINSPVQATLSDVCLYGASKIRERFTEKEVWIAGMTHDSLYGYIPEKGHLEVLKEMKYIMENLPLKKEFDWEPRVAFVIDAEISTTTLADLKSISL